MTGRLRSTARRPVMMSASVPVTRSEEHTSELQSRENLVCRLPLEKKKDYYHRHPYYLRHSRSLAANAVDGAAAARSHAACLDHDPPALRKHPYGYLTRGHSVIFRC